jgi:hypothetical protein
MLGLLPYDVSQTRGMSSSAVLESSFGDRHFTGGFRTYRGPSSFVDVSGSGTAAVESASSSSYYLSRSQDAAAASSHCPVPSSSPSASLMETFAGYGNGIPQPSSLYHQHHQLDLPQHRQITQQQQSVHPALQPMPPSFGVDYRISQQHHRQQQQHTQRLLGEDIPTPQMTICSTTSLFCPSIAAIAAASPSISAAATGGGDGSSLASAPCVDFYYHGGGRGCLPPYRNSFDDPYRMPPLDTAAPTSISAAGQPMISSYDPAIAATAAASVIGPVPFQTLMPFPPTSVAAISPDSGTVGSAKSSLSTSSSLSSGGGLTIDEAAGTSSSPTHGGDSIHFPTDRQSQQQQRLHQSQKPRCRRAAVAVPNDRKDSAYYERRKKNNEAARRSRESRHTKEQTAIEECQAARDRNTKIKIQIELLQRDYNDMCRSVYGRIGPAAASRLVAPPPPPPSMHYGYSSLSQSAMQSGDAASHRLMPSLQPFGESVSGRAKVNLADR